MKTLPPIQPNRGVEAQYRRRLQKLIARMDKSFQYWALGALKRRASAAQLRNVMNNLAKRWQAEFDGLAPSLADTFAAGSGKHTEIAMMQALKNAGFAVEFKMTQPARAAYEAVIADNINLIKSIPAEYLRDVEREVWQTVNGGYDLQALTETLAERYDITHKRAAFIARDQTNKAKATIENARRKDLGFTQAVWQHSHAGKTPRPSHVAANGKVYDLDKGCLIDGEYIYPGEEINCRCTSRVVVPESIQN